MHRRIPLVAAVAGALIIGGAAAGTTLALWRDEVNLGQSQVQSGQLSYDASSPAAVTVDKSSSSSADSFITIADTSAGKNIAQRVTATIGSTPTGISATVGTTCGGGMNTLDTTPASADQTLCVRVTSSTSAVAGSVTVNLDSTQRPTAGWTTPTLTRTVRVNVAESAPTAPSCSDLTNKSVRLDWAGSFAQHTGDYRVTLSWSNGTKHVTPTPTTATSVTLSDAPLAGDTSQKDVSITVSRFANGQSLAPSTAPLLVKWNNGTGWRCS